MKNPDINIADGHISSLVINGLHGRAMSIPAKKPSKREILLIYGHHSALERMYSLAENFAQYGKVTMPDLPGFGGMSSFYTIGEKPSLDNMADYLATFIKLHYKKRHITICAMSYGFVVVTKMLQKYPNIVKQVDIVISMVGFSHHNDFILSPKRQLFYKSAAWLFSGKLSAAFVRYVALQPIFIKTAYRLQASSHPKMVGADKTELKKRLNFEVFLWQANDVRTYMYTTVCFLNLDITNTKVNLPVYHVAVDDDQYFDNKQVVKNFKTIYTNVLVYKAHMPNHAPTVISDVKEAGAFIPPKLRKLLSKDPK